MGDWGTNSSTPTRQNSNKYQSAYHSRYYPYRQFVGGNDQAGDYIIRIADGKCTVEEGTAENPTMTLTADGGYFADVLLGKEDGMKGFMTGKLKLAGDLNLAMKLTSFFKMG